MKKLLVSSVAITAMAGSAIAADLPSIKSAPAVAPVPVWTGFYVGLNAGGTWQNNNSAKIQEYPMWYNPVLKASPIYMDLTAIGSSMTVPTNSSSGFIGGGQIGFNQQFLDKFVVGGEADIQGIIQTNQNSASIANRYNFTYTSYTRPGQTLSAMVDNAYSTSKSLNYFGTARGRLGYLVTPTLLAYGTAGLAYGGVSLSTNLYQRTDSGIDDTEIDAGNHTLSALKIGWTAGAGFEWMFLDNWSAKVEYLYYDLGTLAMNSGQHTNYWGTYNFPPMTTGEMTTMMGYSSAARFNGNIVRAGVNYHFNFASAPVVAKF